MAPLGKWIAYVSADVADDLKGPMISPGYVNMSKQFGMSYNAVNGGLGWGYFCHWSVVLLHTIDGCV